MKKRVFVLTNMMFLLLAGCGKSSEKKTSPIPNDKPTATEEKTTNKDTTSKPEVIKNRTKGAVFNSDINLSFFVADIKSAIKNLPIDVNYAVNSDGLFNLNGETAVELKADLTKANAYQDKDGNTVSSTDVAIDNMNAFKSLVTIPQTFSKVTSLLSIPLSDAFPGQYKALGYEFTKMMNSIPKKTSSNESARANALKALGGENLSLYLNQTGQYFSETHQSGNDEKARVYTESISETPSDNSTVTEIMELISILQEMDISEIQKLDFISLLENIQNGDVITDEMNEQLRAIYEQLRKYSDIFVGGMNIEKTGKTNEDGTVDAGFRFYLNDYGLSQLDKAFVDVISGMTGQDSEELESLLPQLKFTDATVAIDLYKGDNQYTHFGGCYFNFAFDVGSDESKKSNNITMELVMDHNNGEKLSSDYFGSLEKRNQHYKKVSDEFNSYYEKIGKSVSYFDGDSNPRSLDISKENGDNLDAAVILYDTLNDDTKFMLTDAVDKSTIKKNYNEGRDKVKNAIKIYNTLYNLEEIKGSHSLASVATAFNKAMEYKNWELVFKELDSSAYDKVLKVEKDALDSLENQIESYKTSISSLSDDASDAEIKAVLQTELSALRKEVKNYKPSTILGLKTDAKYSSSLFLTDELKEKRDSLVTNALDGPLYQIESLNQDYYVNHLKKIVLDTTKTGKEINDAFNSFVNTYHDIIVSSSMVNSAAAESYVVSKANEEVKENYKSAVTPYFQELTDKAIASYTKMKGENTDTNKTAFTKAVNEAKSVLQVAEECEKKAYGETLTADYSSFLGQLETMGGNI